MSTVYLIHFTKPYVGQQRNPGAKKQGIAKHYLGYANHLDKRIAHHRAGTGSNLCKYAVQSGSELVVARVWKGGTRQTERKLKNLKHHSRLCPICNPKAKNRGKI